MIIVTWNARGTGARSFPTFVRDLKKHYQINFLAILETRCDKKFSATRIEKMGFNNSAIIDSDGYSGGIWCMWDSTIQDLTVLERHRQFLHVQISSPMTPPWVLTIVYASPNINGRRNLWGDLSRVASTIQGAWIVGGDMNATIYTNERKSTAPCGLSHDKDFSCWVEKENLMDLGFVGPPFTWHRGATEARLDRFLANEDWMCLFPNATVTHLPFFKSDHRPLLLKTTVTEGNTSHNRPFRFIASWVLHDDFEEMVRREWKTNDTWDGNIASFTQACKMWNKNIFGHTEARKRKLLRRLDGLNATIARRGTDRQLEDLQFQLWKELEDVVLQDSLLWAQKARAEWTVYGDRNSKYFHARANGRKKVNRVNAIKNEAGDWVYDADIIKPMVVQYFSTLFTEEIYNREELDCSVTYPSIDQDELRWCGRAVHDDEIQDALFSMGPLKSPGPDGFSVLFYQSQWDTVCTSVLNYIHYLLRNLQEN